MKWAVDTRRPSFRSHWSRGRGAKNAKDRVRYCVFWSDGAESGEFLGMDRGDRGDRSDRSAFTAFTVFIKEADKYGMIWDEVDEVDEVFDDS